MILSKQDTFCEAKTTSNTASYTDVLDFGNNGDDVMRCLSWLLLVTSAATKATLTVTWETSDHESFADASGRESKTDLWSRTIATDDLVKGGFPVKDAPLPKGLKRYNRLKLQATSTAGGGETPAYPGVSSYIYSGRDEGQPFVGL